MTTRDVETLLHRSPDLDQLWEDVLTHSNTDDTGHLAAFAQEEVRAFVSYCVNAVESAPEVPEDFRLTKEVALTLRNKQVLFHKTERDSRGRPARARVAGKVQTWKTRPDDFEIPMKYGMRDSFNIVGERHVHPPRGGMIVDTHVVTSWDDPRSWALTEEEAMQRNISANYIEAKWERLNPAVLGRGEHTNAERVVVVGLESLKIYVRWKHAAQEVSFSATTGVLRANNEWNRDALDAWRSDGAWHERGILEVERYREAYARGDNHYVGHVWFEYVGEEPPWQLEHAGDCALSRAGTALYPYATRRCACGALGDGVRENPRRRRR